MVDASVELEQVLPRYKAKNQVANGAVALIRISGDFRKETLAKSEALREREAMLRSRDLDEKETIIREELLKAYAATTMAFDRYSRAFALGTKGLPEVMRINETVKGISKISKALDKDLHKQCKGHL